MKSYECEAWGCNTGTRAGPNAYCSGHQGRAKNHNGDPFGSRYFNVARVELTEAKRLMNAAYDTLITRATARGWTYTGSSYTSASGDHSVRHLRETRSVAHRSYFHALEAELMAAPMQPPPQVPQPTSSDGDSTVLFEMLLELATKVEQLRHDVDEVKASKGQASDILSMWRERLAK